LVVGGANLAGNQALFQGSSVQFANGRLMVNERSALQNLTALFGGSSRSDPMEAEPLLYNARGFSGIVSFRSPFAADRTVVAVLSDSAPALPALVAGMADTKINAMIQGDLSVTKGDGMASFELADRYWVGSLPIWMKIAYWVSQRPVLLGLFALILAVVLAGPVYLYFRRQAQRRLSQQDDNV
ncbi:MAG: cellulose synthase catalytic subunit (UDP-forming), partial [Novosphingobium sp.]|nr:cellulose synthase catalytic subunit (UDP-forming) [Novosphingobium sp.]